MLLIVSCKPGVLRKRDGKILLKYRTEANLSRKSSIFINPMVLILLCEFENGQNDICEVARKANRQTGIEGNFKGPAVSSTSQDENSSRIDAKLRM